MAESREAAAEPALSTAADDVPVMCATPARIVEVRAWLSPRAAACWCLDGRVFSRSRGAKAERRLVWRLMPWLLAPQVDAARAATLKAEGNKLYAENK
jgi:hypothetical protein